LFCPDVTNKFSLLVYMYFFWKGLEEFVSVKMAMATMAIPYFFRPASLTLICVVVVRRD